LSLVNFLKKYIFRFVHANPDITVLQFTDVKRLAARVIVSAIMINNATKISV
jgi:hypothetical protein